MGGQGFRTRSVLRTRKVHRTSLRCRRGATEDQDVESVKNKLRCGNNKVKALVYSAVSVWEGVIGEKGCRGNGFRGCDGKSHRYTLNGVVGMVG